MADLDINTNSTAPNQGPPPTGGGPSAFSGQNNDEQSEEYQPPKDDKERQDALAKWRPEVLSAAENLDRRWQLETPALASVSYKNLSNRQKIQRRQLEQLTIARKLYIIKTGSLPPSGTALRDFFNRYRRDLEQLWTNHFNQNRESGIPKLFRDSYSIAQTKEWLEEEGLFGLKETVSQTKPETEKVLDISTKVKDAVEKVKQKEAEQKKQALNDLRSRVIEKPLSAPMGPAQNPTQEIEDDYDEEEYYNQQQTSLNQTATSQQAIRNTLASAARGGVRSSTTETQTSKRALQRQRGRDAQLKQTLANGGRATGKEKLSKSQRKKLKQQQAKVKTNLDINAKTTSEVNADVNVDAQLEGDEQVTGFEKPIIDIEADVEEGVKAKVLAKESLDEKVGAVEDVSLAPGFAPSQAEQGKDDLDSDKEPDDIAGQRLSSKPKKQHASSAYGQAAEQPVDADNESAEAAFAQQASPSALAAKDASQKDGNADGTGVTVPAEIAVASPDTNTFLTPGMDADAGGKFGEQPGLSASGGESGLNENQLAAEQAKIGIKTPSQLKKDKAAKAVDDISQPKDESLSAESDYLAPQFAPGEEPANSGMAVGVPGRSVGMGAQLPPAVLGEQSEANDQEDEDEEDEDDEDEGGPDLSYQQMLNAFSGMPANEQRNLLNNWLGGGGQKKKRSASLSAWKMRILEAASLKYPELREILEEVKVEAFKAAKGIDASRGKKPKNNGKGQNLEEDLMYWAKRIGMEYIIKWYVFPYGTLSAFIDGGVEAVLAFIALDIYWVISLFTESPYFQGLVRWQKAIIITVNIVLVILMLILITVLVFGYCATQVASLNFPTYCTQINSYLPSVAWTLISGGALR